MTGAPVYVAVPGDKSLSHRALIFAALCEGGSRLAGVLDSADIRSTAECLRRLGVSVPAISGAIVVEGHGVEALGGVELEMDCGNSGTTARLLSGVIAGAGLTARFVGDESLSRRPMKRVAEPLSHMGARFDFDGTDGLPMRVSGSRLKPLDWASDSASAQVKGAILLAGLTAGVRVRVREPARSRDHTERMLAALGADVSVEGLSVTLAPLRATLSAFDFDVPGDPSSAAFFAAWALLTGRAVRTAPISVNPTRIGFLRAIERAGAKLTFDDEPTRCGEPIARVMIEGALDAPFSVGAADVPGLIDELPLLGCLAACAPGVTQVTGAKELRVKESDRIATLVGNLRAIGAEADELPDGFVVNGARRPLRGRVETHGDHRIAMAFGILGALAGNQIHVDDRECVGVSFPGFWTELRRLAA
jgi:3-phosphoshikimate 1-carboxyvinyltransferase